MFGKNEVSKPFREANGNLMVNDLFYTLQGEGPDAGRPALFLRLAKCNLRCYFCDTEFSSGKTYELQTLLVVMLELLQRHNCNLVVITGGEPLLQNIIPIVDGLNSYGISVSIETAGTVALDHLEKYFAPTREINDNLIVCSPKTPHISPDIAPLVGAWKYILKYEGGDASDGLPNLSTQIEGQAAKLYRPPRDGIPIYVQALDEGDVEKNRRNVMFAARVAMAYGYRLSVQMHKLAELA